MYKVHLMRFGQLNEVACLTSSFTILLIVLSIFRHLKISRLKNVIVQMLIKSESFCDDSQHTNSAVFNSSSWHITSHNTCRQTSTQPLPLLAAEQVKSSWCSQHWARLYEELREVSKTPGSTTLEYYMVIISMLTLTPWLLTASDSHTTLLLSYQ